MTQVHESQKNTLLRVQYFFHFTQQVSYFSVSRLRHQTK
jgi:hypothetical protein